MLADMKPLGQDSSGLTEPILTQLPGPHLHLYEKEHYSL